MENDKVSRFSFRWPFRWPFNGKVKKIEIEIEYRNEHIQLLIACSFVIGLIAYWFLS